MSTIELHERGRITEVVLNRPPLNILNIPALSELAAAVERAVQSPACAVLILRSAPGLPFSAGVDVADHVPDVVPLMLDSFHRVIRKLVAAECVTMAVVHGACLGGGFELALSCDILLASESSTFGQPEIKVGCFPPAAAVLLPRRVGWGKAAELILTGHPLTAAGAQEAGLLNGMAPSAGLEDLVRGWTTRFEKLSTAALRCAKAALCAGPAADFSAALERTEDVYLERLMKTKDMAEGVQAFLEKRAPRWSHE